MPDAHSPQIHQDPVAERQLAAWFLGLIALAIAAVLLSTNLGVGIDSASGKLIRAAEGQVSSGYHSPLYTFLIRALSTAKRSPASAARWPGAILFAANVWLAGFIVYRFTRPSITPAILAGVLVLACLPVLQSHTLVSEKPLMCFFCAAALGFFEGFIRDRRPLKLTLVAVTTGLAFLAGISAIALAPSILVGFLLIRITRDRDELPWTFGCFAALFVAAEYLISKIGKLPPPSLEMLSPAWIAVIIFITVWAHRLLAPRTATTILIVLAASNFALMIPWTVKAQREGHDYASNIWSHSPTLIAARRLPPKAVLYSNVPDVIALHAHRRASALPAAGDATGWSSLLDKLASEDSFVVLFNNAPDHSSSGALDRDRRIEQYRQFDDGAIYRADASVWSGADRTAAYNPAAPSTPVRRNNADWMKRHYEYVARAKQGNCDLVFLGDSITDDYRTIPGAWALFEERYSRWRPANFGIDHDRSQHLLWRILNGECDGIRPKVAVILIGTNNSADDPPAAIAKGVEACVRAAQRKMPGTRILLLSLFPRGGSANGNDKRAIIQKVNAIISKLDDGWGVRYLDLYNVFLEPDGTLTKEVMYDGLHPSLKAYHIWADAMQPLLEEMMKAPAATTTTMTTSPAK